MPADLPGAVPRNKLRERWLPYTIHGTAMIGQTLGRYQIVERLGEGGMGVVFRAKDPRLEREVALKVLKQDALHDEDSKRRFRLEARALSQLLHPNIATLFDFDSDRDVDFLVLEFVPGESLAHTLMNGPLPETRARAIALDVTEGLQAAHEKGIVHRDLKPGSIIIVGKKRSAASCRNLPGSKSAAESQSTREQTEQVPRWLPMIFLVPVTLMPHNFWAVKDPMLAQMAVGHVHEEPLHAGRSAAHLPVWRWTAESGRAAQPLNRLDPPWTAGLGDC